jgi:hypothetical protein
VTDPLVRRIPVVAGIAYIEDVRRLPSPFVATLRPEPENRYFRHAIAVMSGGAKVGYVAPEIAGRYHASISASAEPMTCPGRRATHADHESSGVELLLDFSGIPEPA